MEKVGPFITILGSIKTLLPRQ